MLRLVAHTVTSTLHSVKLVCSLMKLQLSKCGLHLKEVTYLHWQSTASKFALDFSCFLVFLNYD
jgi:hypothetical protein